MLINSVIAVKARLSPSFSKIIKQLVNLNRNNRCVNYSRSVAESRIDDVVVD